MSEYINVFLPGQGIDELFVSLWTDDAISLFLHRCILADEIFFPDGQAFSLAAFRKDLPHETGTGRYLKSGGTIQVLQETGTLKGLWNRMDLFSSTEEQVQPSSGDQPSRALETFPSSSSEEELLPEAEDCVTPALSGQYQEEVEAPQALSASLVTLEGQ